MIALGSFALKLWLDQRSGVFDENKSIRALELRKIFTRLGPTFVKLGQGLSTRPDICPPEYLDELAQLQVFFISQFAVHQMLVNIVCNSLVLRIQVYLPIHGECIFSMRIRLYYDNFSFHGI